MMIENQLPRRIRLDLMSPVELAIYEVQQMIEKMPADVKLTNAGIKLQEARNLVADFIDDIPKPITEVKDIFELVEDCKLVREGSEPNGHDCWGNYEYTTYKYVIINDQIKKCWDGWYVRHDGKEVKEIMSESLYKRYNK